MNAAWTWTVISKKEEGVSMEIREREMEEEEIKSSADFIDAKSDKRVGR